MKKLYALFVGLLCLSTQLFAQEADKQAAWKLFQLDSLVQAKMLIDKVTSSGPTSQQAEAWYYRSMIYNTINGREDLKAEFPGIDLQTLDAYKTCLELDKRREFADNCREDIYYLAVEYLNTGISFYDEGLNNEDNAALKKAITYFTYFLDAFNELGSRKAALQKVLKENQLDDNTVIFFRAVAKEKSGNKAGAEEDYTRLVQSKYSDPQLYINLKELYLKQNQRDKAVQVLKTGKERYPEQTELAMQLAMMHAEAKEYTEAIDIAKKYQKSDRTSSLSYVTLAKIYQYMQDWQNAEATFTEALKRDPEDFNVNYAYGLYFTQRGADESSKDASLNYYKAALPYLEKANRINPRSQANLQSLYDVYVKLDNQKKADQIKSRIK